jgi:L-cystine uptake protein TcyP (sodium:dicarboxylate symporter family)
MVPDEFSKKLPSITLGFIIWVAIIAFSLGVLYTKVIDTDAKVIDEVGGLRSDWERDKKEQDRRLEKLEEILYLNN